MSKIKVRIEETTAHPIAGNDNGTAKALGVLVAVIVKRVLKGNPAY